MSEKVGLEVTASANIDSAVKGLKNVKDELTKTAVSAAALPASMSKASDAINKAGQSLNNVKPGANQATQSLVNLGRVAQDAPFGFIGIANNINPLLESFQRLKLETGSTKQALSALGSSLVGAGGLGLAVSVATSLLTVFAMQGMGKTGEEADKAKDKVKSYAEVLDGIVSSLGKEASETAGLIAVLKNENETRVRKLSAIKELQKIQPEIFSNLKLEKGAVEGLDIAYQAYLVNLKSVISAKLIQANIETKITELLKLQGAENTKGQQQQLDSLKTLISSSTTLSEVKKNLQDTKIGGGFLTDKQTSVRISQLNDELKGLFDNLTELSKGIKINEVKIKPEKVTIEAPDKLQDLGSVMREDLFNLSRASGSTLTPTVVVKPEFKIDPEADKRFFESLNAFFAAEKLRAFQANATAAISETVKNIANEAISVSADAIGQALAGNKDALPNLFGNIVKGIGGQVKELGKYLVKIGLEMLAAKKAVESLGITPQVAIIAGIGLQILGATLAASFNKKATTGFATGVRNLQQGGVYDVGERGRERVFLPAGSSVIPNNELNAYGGGGGSVFIPSVRLAGPDLVIAFQRASQLMGRNG